MTHAPLFRFTGMADGVLQMGKGFSNPDQVDWLLEKFSKFERIHIISGHTHTNYFCRYSDRVTEQNNIAVAASSWQIYGPEKRHLSKDGTPGGYMICTFDGKNIERQYNALGREIDECQFIVYDLNTVPAAYGGTSGSNELLINV